MVVVAYSLETQAFLDLDVFQELIFGFVYLHVDIISK
jgi:hypothetical protein